MTPAASDSLLLHEQSFGRLLCADTDADTDAAAEVRTEEPTSADAALHVALAVGESNPELSVAAHEDEPPTGENHNNDDEKSDEGKEGEEKYDAASKESEGKKRTKLHVGDIVRMNRSGVLYATSGQHNTMVEIKSINSDGTYDAVRTSQWFDDDESPSALPKGTDAPEQQNVEGQFALSLALIGCTYSPVHFSLTYNTEQFLFVVDFWERMDIGEKKLFFLISEPLRIKNALITLKSHIIQKFTLLMFFALITLCA